MCVTFSFSIGQDPIETEESFARRILSIVVRLIPFLIFLLNVFYGYIAMLFTNYGSLFFYCNYLVTQDYNGDGQLSFSEFSELIDAFGNQQAAKKV